MGVGVRRESDAFRWPSGAIRWSSGGAIRWPSGAIRAPSHRSHLEGGLTLLQPAEQCGVDASEQDEEKIRGEQPRLEQVLEAVDERQLARMPPPHAEEQQHGERRKRPHDLPCDGHTPQDSG